MGDGGGYSRSESWKDFPEGDFLDDTGDYPDDTGDYPEGDFPDYTGGGDDGDDGDDGDTQGVSQEFIDAVNEAAKKFSEANFEGIEGTGVSSSFDSMIGDLLKYASGEKRDPRFEEYRRARQATLNRTQSKTRQVQSQYLNRRGIGQSSAAALNQTLNLEKDLGLEQQQLTADLGMEEMASQKEALSMAGTLAPIEQALQLGGIESRNLAQQANLTALAASIETLSLPEQLRIAEIAAENAGTINTSGGSGSGKLLF